MAQPVMPRANASAADFRWEDLGGVVEAGVYQDDGPGVEIWPLFRAR